MQTINDLIKETREEALRLDLYFYEQDLKSCNPTERDAIMGKIRQTEQLLLQLND